MVEMGLEMKIGRKKTGWEKREWGGFGGIMEGRKKSGKSFSIIYYLIPPTDPCWWNYPRKQAGHKQREERGGFQHHKIRERERSTIRPFDVQRTVRPRVDTSVVCVLRREWEWHGCDVASSKHRKREKTDAIRENGEMNSFPFFFSAVQQVFR